MKKFVPLKLNFTEFFSFVFISSPNSQQCASNNLLFGNARFSENISDSFWLLRYERMSEPFFSSSPSLFVRSRVRWKICSMSWSQSLISPNSLDDVCAVFLCFNGKLLLEGLEGSIKVLSQLKQRWKVLRSKWIFVSWKATGDGLIFWSYCFVHFKNWNSNGNLLCKKPIELVNVLKTKRKQIVKYDFTMLVNLSIFPLLFLLIFLLRQKAFLLLIHQQLESEK